MAAFAREHGGAPRWLVRSPGRANVIGEHTDYNHGFVLPFAIDRDVWLALRPRAGGDVRLRSLDLDDEPVVVTPGASRRATAGWGAYLAGVADALTERGYPLVGWEGVLASDVPIGAGLASSAALTVALVTACVAASGATLSARERASVAWSAERDGAGVRCGPMDPLIASCAVAGHALFVDCRTLASELVPIPARCSFVLLDTGVRRELASSEYNARRGECEAAAAHVGVASLRDLSLAQLEACRGGMEARVYRRARHVVTENARVLDAVRALRDGDVASLGRILNASHESLRDDFEVSCAELDLMARSALLEPECLGARMMGGGFGGAVLALVAGGEARALSARVAARYAAQTGRTPESIVVSASAGAELLGDASSARG